MCTDIVGCTIQAMEMILLGTILHDTTRESHDNCNCNNAAAAGNLIILFHVSQPFSKV